MHSFKGFWLIMIAILAGCSTGERPQIKPEKTDYQQTSLYKDVMEVAHYVDQNYDHANLQFFGTSPQGKKLPLLIFSNRNVKTPEEARKLGRPVVLFLGDIHSGEVEGKEALQRIALDMMDGKYHDTINQLTILFAPIYNADGNDMIDKKHRTNQNGPFGGVGTRPNAQGLNLNRDFTKLDTPEAQGLMSNVIAKWDPDMLVDLHTTNGSYHGYHMTYAPPLNPNTDERLIRYQRQQMIPEITKLMSMRGWNTFYYGFYRNHDDPSSGWVTYSHTPRYSTNYYGLRNRMALLSETYAYVNFRDRIRIARDFVMTVMKYCTDHAKEIISLRDSLDADYREFEPGQKAGITFDYADPVPGTILAGTVDTLKRQDVDGLTMQRVDSVREVKTQIYGRFKPTAERTVPYAYALDNRAGRYDTVVTRLQQHGIALYKAGLNDPVDVKRFEPEKVGVARTYEHHDMVQVEGSFEDTKLSLRDWIIIPTNNSNRNLIFYLMEPESDDGLVKWNFFDAALRSGDPFPVVKIMEERDLQWSAI